MFKIKRLVMCSATAIAAVGTQVSAQEDSLWLEEIVVTANKKAENLQDVALSVTAVSQGVLDSSAVTNLASLSNRVAGLSTVETASNRNVVSIRGLTPTSFQNGTSPLVAVYIDDLPISEGVTPDIGLFDLERVEVLRGPQGTLYGEGSMGGTIKYVTASPNTSEFSAGVNGEVSSARSGGENYSVNAMLNTPLVENQLAMRITASYLDNSGFVDNAATGEEDVDDFSRQGARISFLYTPMDRLSIRLTGMYQQFDGGEDSRVFADAGNAFAPPLLNDFGDDVGYFQLRGGFDEDLSSLALSVQYDIGGGSLTSATAFYERETLIRYDESATARVLEESLSDLLGSPFFIQQGSLAEFDDTFEVFTQEFRYTGSIADKASYIVGIYYREREEKTDILATSEEFGDVLTNVFLIESDGFLQGSGEFTEQEQFALFGQATYSLTDAFRATFGVRYFDEKVSGNVRTTQLDPITFEAFDTIPAIPDLDESDTLFKVGIEYDVFSDTLLFVNFGQGTRPGGLNGRFDPQKPAALSPRTYQSDTVDAIDMGIKTTFMDGRALLNASVFFNDFSDIQTEVIDGAQFQTTGNLGAAETYGVEIEAAFQATSQLLLGGNLTLLEAEFTETVGPVIDGQKIPLARDVSASAYMEYRHPLENGSSFLLNTSISYADDTVGGVERPNPADPFFSPLPSYTLVDLSLGYETANWVVELFARNLTDETVRYSGQSFQGFVRNKPRTLGLRCRLSF